MLLKLKYFLLSLAVLLGLGVMSMGYADDVHYNVYINNNTNGPIEAIIGSAALHSNTFGGWSNPIAVQAGQSAYEHVHITGDTGRLFLIAWPPNKWNDNILKETGSGKSAYFKYGIPGAYQSGDKVGTGGGSYQFSVGGATGTGNPPPFFSSGSAKTYNGQSQ